MARLFDSDAKFLKATTGLITLNVTQGTVVFWFLPNWAWNDNVIHYLVEFSGTNWFGVAKWSSNNWYAGWYTGGEYRITSSASALVQGVWNLLALTWDVNGSPTKSEFFVNASSVGTKTTLATWDTSTATFCKFSGDTYLGVDNNSAMGRLAYVEIYDKVLTQAQIADIYAKNPRSDMVNRYIINGTDSPEVDDKGSGPGMVVNGSPAAANGPYYAPVATVAQVARETLAEISAIGYVAQVVRETLAEIGSIGYVSQVAREVLAEHTGSIAPPLTGDFWPVIMRMIDQQRA